MELTLLRIPIVGLAGGILSMLIGATAVVACDEKPTETLAPAKAIAPAPSPADPATVVPAEIRAQIPTDAALKELIAGEGAIASPKDGAESHQRHPYDLPDGAAGIVAVVTWKDTALESVRSSSGTAALHHAVQADEALAEDKWFLHVNADAGLSANPGKHLQYSYAVYSY
jgi:hypothetical protein